MSRGVSLPTGRVEARDNGQAADSSAAEPASGVGAPGARPLTDTGGRPMATILPPLTDSAEQARGFNPMDFPAGYANDVMHHVIDHNCHGCTIPEPADVAEHGDGGCCGILAAIFVSDNIPELTYDGTTVRCLARLAVGEANE